MGKIRFGIVGLGNQGSSYLLNLFDKGRIKDGIVVAACDVNEEKIKAARAKTVNENIDYFTDYKEMLSGGKCDAVLVETPHYLHPEIVIECLKRGINVICDKPAGVYTKQVREMNEAAKACNARFAMMFNQRTNCVYRKMKQLIENGEIGELQRVTWIITNWFRTQNYYDSGSWRATWNGEGGGVLINQCPHQLDLLQWVTGQLPNRVNAFCKYGKWHDVEAEDEVTAYLEYAGGATGVFITTTGEYPGTNRFEVSGTKGKLLCENDKLFLYKNDADTQEFSKTARSGFGSPKCEITEVETDGINSQHAGVINNFVAALLGEEELIACGSEGIRSVELMNAIELSGWKGGASVKLPVDEAEYLAELNVRRKSSKAKVADNNSVTDTSNTYGGATT